MRKYYKLLVFLLMMMFSFIETSCVSSRIGFEENLDISGYKYSIIQDKRNSSNIYDFELKSSILDILQN